ncbi:MAG: endonuclease/exonuclease/phosphatase family protein [Pseudonocardia sp.]|nr:endonuclease/exonuclease/phosphatase family protein [Pseudonocardia sp.]
MSVRATFATAVALVLFGTAGSAAAVRVAPVRVMTWNVATIRFAPADWAPVVAEQAPDVLGLQEICTGDAEELRELLRRDHGLEYRLVPGAVPTSGTFRSVDCADRGIGSGAFGQAVLTRLQVVPDSTTVTSLPLRAGIDDDEPRGWLSVALRAGDGREFRVQNTHLSTGGDIRAEQIAALAADASRYPASLVLGDLNTTPDETDLLAPLLENFRDAGGDADLPSHEGRRIDYVFARGLGAVGAARLAAPGGSDHRPVVSDIG